MLFKQYISDSICIFAFFPIVCYFYTFLVCPSFLGWVLEWLWKIVKILKPDCCWVSSKIGLPLQAGVQGYKWSQIILAHSSCLVIWTWLLHLAHLFLTCSIWGCHLKQGCYWRIYHSIGLKRQCLPMSLWKLWLAFINQLILQ